MILKKVSYFFVVLFFYAHYTQHAYCSTNIESYNLCDGVIFSCKEIINPKPSTVKILDIDPEKVLIKLAVAQNKCVALETVSELAQEHNALAAINGGFCENNGNPAGILKKENVWFTNTKLPRAALGWTNDGKEIIIDIVNITWALTINGHEYPVARLNQERKENKKQNSIVYTPVFNHTTLTDNNGTEFIIIDNIITEIRQNNGDTVIPDNGFVFSVHNDSTLDLSEITIGDPVILTHTCVTPDKNKKNWEKMDNILGGTPLLISNKNVIQDFSQEKIAYKFEHKRYPRTAVGILENGHWLLVVIDEQYAGLGSGMTLHDLADFMHTLGCTNALNLCGGISTNMYIKSQKKPNLFEHVIEFLGSAFTFGIETEKKVSNALVIIPKE